MRRLVLLVVLVLAVLATPAGAVVGGTPVPATKYPWFASIDECGGTLIAPDRVLTAAHCVEDRTPAALGTVRFGGGAATRKIVAFASEPGFVAAELDGSENPEAASHDVAVLALDRPVTGIAPVVLASGGATGRVELIGRGRTSSAGSVPMRAGRSGLRRATLAAMPNARCAAYWHRTSNPAYHHAFDPRVMLCATAAHRGICQGDSGGPLLRRTRTGAVRQVGVVSWLGDRCGVGPSVFARVWAMRTFIDQHDEPWAPVAGAPGRATITGTPAAGAVLTCALPPFTAPPATLTFRWTAHRAGTADTLLQTGPSSTYTPTAQDAGAQIRCAATAATAGGAVRLLAESPRIAG